MDDKKVRTNLIYVGNNPVERHLVENAEDYRWNYVAYAVSDSPFSRKYVQREASSALKKAVNEVRSQYGKEMPLNYQMLKRLFEPLDTQESQQLIDYIISLYNVIDYASALEYFGGSYKRFITALHSTTGSEHDIREKKTGKSDIYYAQMSNILISEYGINDIHEILTMDKMKLSAFLRGKTLATGKQISKYLRMRDWEQIDTQ